MIFLSDAVVKGFFVLGVGLITLFSCTREYLPKPIGYNRLVLPDPSYRTLPDSLPYTFEYSQHAKLLADTSWISERFWIEIYYPALKSNIHITYKKLENSEQVLKELLNDSYTLTAKHQIKAYAIDEVIVQTPSGQTAIVAELDGDVPSQMQFTITDSTQNFFSGEFYLNTKFKNDSLGPAIEYMKKDIMHLINTFNWNKK